MPSITERIAAAQQAQQSAEAEQRAANQNAAAQRFELAADRLRALLASELGITESPAPTTFRSSKQYEHERGEYIFLGTQIEGYWLAITLPEPGSTFEEYLVNRKLLVVPRCPNGHAAAGYEQRYGSDESWDSVLLRGATKQAELAQEGKCYPCLKEGKQRALRQQVIDRVRNGSREAAVAAISALASQSYISDDAWEAALRAADQVW